ncbi:hypothetical protein RF371_11690 [Companilactobacillus paralimentarius]|uniref:hypothetical protein n=1 Tax=Companilactobacillus paralimentarius TaxID=83526 RepID=UPI00285327AD|nr:hypothetical protein [Companilactobacillus paralimentarius]MDR4934454.1 hypothetical protein [Companilactobacillus paralimentarius]
MTDIRIRNDDEYNPVGDCEPYDKYVDDKGTDAINKDVDAIDQALETFGKSSENIGYANGTIGEIYERLDGVTNPDDRDAFNSQIQRISDKRDGAKNIRDQAKENVFKAFEHYYS